MTVKISKSCKEMANTQLRHIQKSIDTNIAYVAKASSPNRRWINDDDRNVLTDIYIELNDIIKEMLKEIDEMPQSDWRYVRVDAA